MTETENLTRDELDHLKRLLYSDNQKLIDLMCEDAFRSYEHSDKLRKLQTRNEIIKRKLTIMIEALPL